MKNKVNRLFIPLFIACISCFQPFSVFANQTFRHIGIADGLSQINILSIYQDEIGRMWFGSYEGLNVYNGKEIKIYRPSQGDNGLTQNEIYAITGNKKGAVYLRAGSDLVRYDLNKQKFKCLKQGDIRNIHFQNDTLWAITHQNILYYTEGNDDLSVFCKLPAGTNATSIFVTNDKILAGTGKGIIVISKNEPTEQKIILENSEIKCFYSDRKENLWIGTDGNGLFHISKEQKTIAFTHSADCNSISNNYIRSIIEDDYGNIWVGTFYGLNKYNPATQQWTSYQHNELLSYSLSHSSVFALYKDIQGSIWVGTYFGGVNCFNPRNDVYNFIGANMNDPNYISFPFVGKMTEDLKGNFWICTEGGGLNYFDRETQQFKKFTHNENNPNSISHNNLKCIWLDDKNEQLYIGTHTGGLSIYDIKKERFRNLQHRANNELSLPNDIVNEMQYYKNKLVVLTQSGISFMDLKTERFSLPFENKEVRAILNRPLAYETFLIDSRDKLWLAETNGGIICIDLKTDKITSYHHDIDQAGSIGKFKVAKIFENSTGRIFFGTIGSGLYEYLPETDSFRNYTAGEKHLLSDYCYYIDESPYRYLMILHNRGISIFDPVTYKLQYSYDFLLLFFNQGSSICFSKDGETFLGGTTGLMSFYEQQLYTVTNNFKIYFDKLYVNNEEVVPDDDTKILSNTLAQHNQLVFKHKQNNFVFEIAAADYLSITNHNFEYMLEGFDKEWLPLSASQQITYTNINPGNYTLSVRDLDDNNAAANKISIDIKIKAPFYATIPAYILYGILIVAILYFLIRFNTRQTKLRASLEFERKEKERIEELNQIKLRFFTNISHEFKTPLTLIIGQVESLLELNKLSPAIYNRMLRIYKNTQQMRNLISELLDFRKQEQGFLKLKVKHSDIISFSKEIYMSFYEYAIKSQITYKFENFDEKIEAWFDPVQLQKVIYNILSNAFKYTSKGGSITLSIGKEKGKVCIRIKDSGIGISQDSIDKIFERFYQTGNLTPNFSPGTGIGLALSKGIVELHKGEITVESKIGEGSVFNVILQLGNAHFGSDEIAGDEEDIVLASESGIAGLYPIEEIIENEDIGKNNDESENNKPVVLIVEDNSEIREMLEDAFAPLYSVLKATNGKEGLEIANEHQPDIVLSDVMMPIMSGKEMCYKIKNNIETSYIPVVLLTAQTAVEYAVEGFMYGADDYITKPFNIKLLISRCNNLIKTRKMLLDKFNSQGNKAAVIQSLNEMDQKLIDKASRIITENFEEPDFDMNVLASELGMGRSKLYNKIKEITGLTPNEFTLKLRLDEGLRLLNNNSYLTISEISYKVGFSSARYFSKCFKSFYGIAPNEVKKDKKEKME